MKAMFQSCFWLHCRTLFSFPWSRVYSCHFYSIHTTFLPSLRLQNSLRLRGWLSNCAPEQESWSERMRWGWGRQAAGPRTLLQPQWLGITRVLPSAWDPTGIEGSTVEQTLRTPAQESSWSLTAWKRARSHYKSVPPRVHGLQPLIWRKSTHEAGSLGVTVAALEGPGIICHFSFGNP